ncbi:hypothetical protein M422DRAFT_263557 [Sphaerobolus stellatus SS14]|uniref:Uncharacterized protein n=1 Tax=Sphaerobolus stellatus (strain SS14) TaxID=990650 RepID=A0A0C9UHV8_SPHS4|nr:hypothetical protein M422DRAFT_263557 [Sphaerobolus stellatus SS14]
MPPYAPSRRTHTTSPPSEDQFEGSGNQAVSVSTAKGAEIDLEEINRIFETHKPKSNAACGSKQLQKTTGSTSKANYRPYTKPSNWPNELWRTRQNGSSKFYFHLIICL